MAWKVNPVKIKIKTPGFITGRIVTKECGSYPLKNNQENKS